MAYEINYDDVRFKEVEADRKEALSETEKLYSGMADESGQFYQAQIDASKEWAETQAKNQQAQTDFAIEKIEQQKEQANKDYIKEQSGAYVDWQKESNRYGANAEQMASQGLTNSGYSESSQVSMYNTYQNRVAVARESYNLVIQNYNNAITEARLQNNAALAQIAYDALQTQLQLSLEGFQYKNQLLSEMVTKKEQVETRYDNKYQAVLDQMNKDNALQEELRQFNATYSLQQQQLREEIRQYNQDYDLKKEQLQEQIRQFDEEIARLKANDAQDYQLEIKKLEQQKDIANAQLEESKRQFDTTTAQKKASNSSASITKSSGSGSSSVNKSTGSGTSSGGRTHSGSSRSFGTYEEAVSYLQSQGVSGDGGLMTKNEWLDRKARGSKSAESSYTSYTQYLNNFVNWTRETTK